MVKNKSVLYRTTPYLVVQSFNAICHRVSVVFINFYTFMFFCDILSVVRCCLIRLIVSCNGETFVEK